MFADEELCDGAEAVLLEGGGGRLGGAVEVPPMFI